MTGPMPSITLAVPIAAPAAEVVDFAARPANLPAWAAAFAQSVRIERGECLVETADGTVALRFVERNPFGVLDHTVTLPSGEIVHCPMRVVPNGDGCEILFTVFRRPGMTEAAWRADAALVESDLLRLKRLMEAR
ncbi:MAG: SRPBCC family protein [Burkholderiaceae bacterium]